MHSLLNSNWAYCVICKFITAQMVRSHSPLHISLASQVHFHSNEWNEKEYARNYRRRKWFWYWQENCSNCTLNGIVHENSIHIHFDGESSNIAKYVWCIRQEILCSWADFFFLSPSLWNNSHKFYCFFILFCTHKNILWDVCVCGCFLMPFCPLTKSFNMAMQNVPFELTEVIITDWKFLLATIA